MKSKYKRVLKNISIPSFLISIIAAGFTYWQADIARDTARKQLRAYVSADIILNDSLIWIKNRFAIEFRLINYGQTPAQQIRIDGQIQKCEYPIDKSRIDYDSSANLDKRWSVFPSNNITTSSNGWIFADSTLDKIGEKDICDILKSKYRIYFFARIWYLDVFGSNRSTQICRFIYSLDTLQDGSIKKVHWADYKEYNNFD